MNILIISFLISSGVIALAIGLVEALKLTVSVMKSGLRIIGCIVWILIVADILAYHRV